MENTKYLVFGLREAIECVNEFEAGRITKDRIVELFEDDFCTSDFMKVNSLYQLGECMHQAKKQQDYTFINQETYELLK